MLIYNYLAQHTGKISAKAFKIVLYVFKSKGYGKVSFPALYHVKFNLYAFIDGDAKMDLSSA